jgi:hypothetical protein
MLDELRDYRWYTEDGIHPGPAAVKKVFEKFTQTFLAPECTAVINDIRGLRTDIAHIPIVAASVAYKQHLMRTLSKASALQTKYCHYKIGFSEEILILERKLQEFLA